MARHKLLYPTEYAGAVLGVVETEQGPRLVLSKKQMVQIFIRDADGFELGDDPETIAIEYLEFNTWGAYIENGPLYLEDI